MTSPVLFQLKAFYDSVILCQQVRPMLPPSAYATTVEGIISDYEIKKIKKTVKCEQCV